MKNLTLAIDEDILDRVRVVAAHRKTTVNAMVRAFLSEIAVRDEERTAKAGAPPARPRTGRLGAESALREAETEPFRGAPAIANPSHLGKLAAAARPDSDYELPREAPYDRERAQAEAYLAARRNLMKLIDDPEGDLGPEGWNRARLYEP